MNLSQMTDVANAFTDENFRTTLTKEYANEAISRVNAELNCSLPFINDTTTEYTALTETWLRNVIIPYMCYSIKMNDSSIAEASVFLSTFEQGLNTIEEKKLTAIPSTYQSAGFEDVYQIDMVSGLSNTFGIGVKPYTVAKYDEYTYYYIGDYVLYNSTKYICIKDSESNLPTNTTYWREID